MRVDASAPKNYRRILFDAYDLKTSEDGLMLQTQSEPAEPEILATLIYILNGKPLLISTRNPHLREEFGLNPHTEPCIARISWRSPSTDGKEYL
jgi:hypothetical protein